MSENEPIKILVVDDLADKLLVYRSVLEEPDLQVVTANSGAEALRQLLLDEFAVILLDVNMPGMDGFETASLIRGRKRCAHTPIIFVTAHADELHALRGYQYGAVDYMLTPVVPEVLRTKVRVFVELFRLNQQVRRQAEERLAAAEGERKRLAAVLENAGDLFALADASGRTVHINATGLHMLGIPRPSAEYPLWIDQRLWNEGLEVAASNGLWFGESTIRTLHGHEIPVSKVVLAHKGRSGRTDSYSIIARDISERRRAELSVAESERRYRNLVHALPAALYTCDAQGRVTLFNKAAVDLWGREPELNVEYWCGSASIYNPDGSRLALDDCPMAVTIKQGRAVRDQEIIIERPDGTRRNVLPHPEPVFDADGKLVGAINMLMDITDLKAAERALRESESRLRAMFGQAAVGIVLVDLQGRFAEVNQRMCQIVGRPASELRGLAWQELTHPDDWNANRLAIEQVVSGERTECSIEKRYQRPDGSWVWVNVTLSPLLDDAGHVYRMMKVVEDIGARKLAELEVQRHREHLEQLVRERTAELEASHERLRLADRLAAIGTLAAGLGHDMGNLLLPMRMRLDALESLNLPSEARDDIQAIRDACEYLKRLSRGLRLFALSPEETRASGVVTDLAVWWADIAPFLRNALTRGIELHVEIPHDLPRAAISPHMLTQAVYNLVQNAGDAMKSRGAGRVSITASARADAVVLEVADDGPGMSDEVLRRCMEPFFTTKTRGISTGLGLALVRGAVYNAGGSIDITSRAGAGTTFRLSIPLAGAVAVRAAANLHAAPTVACVDLRDARISAFVATLLASMNVRVVREPWSAGTPAPLLVIDSPADRFPELKEFLRADPARRAVLLGDAPTPSPSHQLVVVETSPSAGRLRTVLSEAIFAVRTPPQEALA